jgi:hypothetical protein
MKNITFSADEDLIERARMKARAQRSTLNEAFREWLAQFAAEPSSEREVDVLLKRVRYVDAGRHFTRDELNER